MRIRLNGAQRARAGRKPPEDREPARLFTRLHMPAAGPSVAQFRVMATLANGRRALVCVGRTRAEVLERARRLRQLDELPDETQDLVLQSWAGGLTGGWQDVRGRAAYRPRIRRAARREQAWFARL